MSKPIRFGVVGTNFVSDSFMAGIQITEGVEVAVVCSGRKENAIRFAKRYQISDVFDTYQDMAESNLIDAVYIATPNSMHFEQASFFLNHHIPVFLEKPMTINDQQAKQLFDLVQKNNTYLHDGIMPLYSPNLDVLRSCMAEIGPIRRVVLSFQKYSSRYDAYLQGENPTTFRKELANGAFMDLGIYTTACAIALFGKPHQVSSSASLLSTGVDGLNTAVFHYEGFDAVVMNSKITNSKVISEIQGERGIIQFKEPSTLTSISLTLHNEECRQIEVSQLTPFHHQLNDFKDSINQKRMQSIKVPHRLSIDIIEIVTKCRIQSGVVYLDDQ